MDSGLRDQSAIETFAEVAKLWAPPPKLTVSEWADQNRRLAREASARTGDWVTRPYQREPMDAFTDPKIHTIVLMVARQTLKTEFINNCIGYRIDQDPGPMLMVHFRDTDCQKWSKIRFSPMVRETPCLRGKVETEKRGSGKNTIDYKTFPGGHLSVVASQSPGNLAALPIRDLYCDEIDKYPASSGGAGDPISLAGGRQEEFWNRKTVLACTPTIDGRSRIQDAYQESDQREYEVRCPACHAYQIPNWGQVKFGEGASRRSRCEGARYLCGSCGDPWDDSRRWRASRDGRYRATAEFNGIAGFRVSGLARLGTKLSSMVNEWLASEGNPEARKTFINEQLAEFWKEPGEAPPDAEKLMARREESYRLGQVPEGVLFLTAGVDVQKTWLEGYVWGWGWERHRWLVDHWRIECDPFNASAQDWLDERLALIYRFSSGVEMSLAKFGIDSGYATQEVYGWGRRHGAHRVLVMDGRATGELVGYPSLVDVEVRGKKISNGAKLWPFNASKCKSELYGLLNRERPKIGEPLPPGWVHFPIDADEEFFRQLTSERFVMRMVRGARKGYWEKDGSLRNEALDCHNMARAAACVEGFDRADDDDWNYLARKVGVPVTAARNGAPPAPPQRVEARVPVSPLPPPAARQQQRASSNFMRELLG